MAALTSLAARWAGVWLAGASSEQRDAAAAAQERCCNAAGGAAATRTAERVRVSCSCRSPPWWDEADATVRGLDALLASELAGGGGGGDTHTQGAGAAPWPVPADDARLITKRRVGRARVWRPVQDVVGTPAATPALARLRSLRGAAIAKALQAPGACPSHPQKQHARGRRGRTSQTWPARRSSALPSCTSWSTRDGARTARLPAATRLLKAVHLTAVDVRLDPVRTHSTKEQSAR